MNSFKLPMGSGSLATAGWGYAAYAHDYGVNLNGTGGPELNFSTPGSTVSQYAAWTAPASASTPYSPASGHSWDDFFYFGFTDSSCKPATCASLGACGGQVPDGCGGILNCGTCPATTGCDQEYFPPGYGTPIGWHTMETVTGPTNATSMYQIVGGQRIPLGWFIDDAGYPSSGGKPGEFVVGQQANGVTTTGATIGSTIEVVACTGAACTAPWNVKVANCCVPLTCESDWCGSTPDGCGGTLNCGGCGEGLMCVKGFCESTDPIQRCEDAGGTWIGNARTGHCVYPPPPHCGGKGQPVCQ